jgi:hypothetical protein
MFKENPSLLFCSKINKLISPNMEALQAALRHVKVYCAFLYD